MTVLELIGDLMEAFPRQAIRQGTIQVYHRELSDLPEGPLTAAVRSLIRSSQWFPTIHEIREATAERVLGLPDEDEALAQVEARMSWTREGRLDGDRPELHDSVHAAVLAVGGFHAFRSSEKPDVVRGQFLRLYRSHRTRALRQLVVGDPGAEKGNVLLAEYRAAP